jgi:1,4-alpha-glucan branching enzyme
MEGKILDTSTGLSNSLDATVPLNRLANRPVSPEALGPAANNGSFDGGELAALLDGRQPNPKLILGPRKVTIDGKPQSLVRVFAPTAQSAWIMNSTGDTVQAMRKVHEEGLFEVVCDSDSFDTQRGLHKFRLSVEGKIMTTADPYAFDTIFSDMDLHLFGEGNHFEIYNFLGAQLRTLKDVTGVNFSVWAPNAAGVNLIGNFNEWDGRSLPMSRAGTSGIWELFVPHVEAGAEYKFRVTDQNGKQIDKSDPYGFFAEQPPKTASIVADLEDFAWTDTDWMSQRENHQGLDQPISVYELHLGSWRTDHEKHNGWINYRDLATQIVDYCKEMQFTHIELMPISEHPFTGSWGYQTVGYFSATSRYGNPQDLMHLVNHCHENGIGVLIDWVPAHFPKDGHGLNYFDGTALYEHADPRQGHHPDWETSIFNYGRNEVRNFLVANALFWLDKFHIDGLRVDAVASMLYLDYSREEGEWIPNKYGGRENLDAIEFLKQFNEQTHARFPGTLTIAEESTAWGGVSRPTYAGGLGFSIKWNMGWMNDTLRYFKHESIHRKYHHDELTFSLIYAFTENFSLPLSHDEVVHGKGSLINQMPGDTWQKFANLRLLYAYMWTHPGKKLLFMGNEMAQWNEWDCNSQLQWDLLGHDSHRGMQKLVSDLNGIYRREPGLHQLDFTEEGFEWIESGAREDSVIGYLRKGKDPSDLVMVVCNFTPVVRQRYRIGVPFAGEYREIFNSDSEYYAGSNVGNMSSLSTEAIESQGRENSITLTLPPLSAVILKPVSS